MLGSVPSVGWRRNGADPGKLEDVREKAGPEGWVASPRARGREAGRVHLRGPGLVAGLLLRGRASWRRVGAAGCGARCRRPGEAPSSPARVLPTPDPQLDPRGPSRPCARGGRRWPARPRVRPRPAPQSSPRRGQGPRGPQGAAMLASSPRTRGGRGKGGRPRCWGDPAGRALAARSSLARGGAGQGKPSVS